MWAIFGKSNSLAQPFALGTRTIKDVQKCQIKSYWKFANQTFPITEWSLNSDDDLNVRERLVYTLDQIFFYVKWLYIFTRRKINFCQKIDFVLVGVKQNQTVLKEVQLWTSKYSTNS